jgi:hypothetical protein
VLDGEYFNQPPLRTRPAQYRTDGLEDLHVSQLDRLAEVLAFNYNECEGGTASVDEGDVKLMSDPGMADKVIAKTAANV